MYSMVNHIKMYASLVSTVLESICDNMAVKKATISHQNHVFLRRNNLAQTQGFDYWQLITKR